MAKEYIDREVAIESIKNDLPNIVNYRKADAMECLETLPATDVAEVRHGKWEYGKWEQGHWVKGNERCRCSVCDRDFAVDNLNIWYGCPHCLAKMDG